MAFSSAEGSTYIHGSSGSIESSTISSKEASRLHRPALDIDLTSLLPLLVAQLLLGKGRGKDFAESQAQKVRNASRKSDEAAKAVIRHTLRENFFPEISDSDSLDVQAGDPKRKHLSRVAGSCQAVSPFAPPLALTHACHVLAEWFFGVLMKRPPWQNWTNDIYDAMRCIDFLPIA